MPQKVPLYAPKSTLIRPKKYPYMPQKVPLYAPKSTLIRPKKYPYHIIKPFIYALLRTPKRYKNIIKDIKVFYNIF